MTYSKSADISSSTDYKSQLFEAHIKPNNVLNIEVTKELEYDKEKVTSIIREVRNIAGEKKYLVLINAGPLSTINYEAVKVLAEPQAMQYAHAKAYVIHTISQRLMGNFFLRFLKPAVPVKFFRDKRKAEAWLLRNFRNL